MHLEKLARKKHSSLFVSDEDKNVYEDAHHAGIDLTEKLPSLTSKMATDRTSLKVLMTSSTTASLAESS